MNSLRTNVEKLIMQIKITKQIKEIVVLILHYLGYSEDQIAIIFDYKNKKKNIVNLFQFY